MPSRRQPNWSPPCRNAQPQRHDRPATEHSTESAFMTTRFRSQVKAEVIDQDRRRLLAAFSAGFAAAGAATVLPLRQANADTAASATSPDAIRPFHVHFPDDDLAELRLRLKKTRWPDKETVKDQSQGIP